MIILKNDVGDRVKSDSELIVLGLKGEIVVLEDLKAALGVEHREAEEEAGGSEHDDGQPLLVLARVARQQSKEARRLWLLHRT